MRTLLIASDRSGCGYYRCVLPAQAAVDAGHPATVDYGWDCDASVMVGGEIDVRHIDIPEDVDVVSVQRPMTRRVLAAMEWLKRNRPDIGLVMELDDDMAAIPASHAAYIATAPHFSPDQNYDILYKAARLADIVTVSTPALAARYGTNSNARVIANAVDGPLFQQVLDAAATPLGGSAGIPAGAVATLQDDGTGSETSDLVTIGWSGSIGMHPDDVQVAAPSLLNAMRSFGADKCRFLIVGPSDGATRALGGAETIAGVNVEATGWRKYVPYLGEMSRFDIGIVPLADTRFNEAKSWLKAMEMSALGVPVVASARREACAFQETTPINVVRDRPRDWMRALDRLMRDADLRHEQGARCREAVLKHHEISSRVPAWVAAWRDARDIARARQPVMVGT